MSRLFDRLQGKDDAERGMAVSENPEMRPRSRQGIPLYQLNSGNRSDSPNGSVRPGYGLCNPPEYSPTPPSKATIRISPCFSNPMLLLIPSSTPLRPPPIYVASGAPNPSQQSPHLIRIIPSPYPLPLILTSPLPILEYAFSTL